MVVLAIAGCNKAPENPDATPNYRTIEEYNAGLAEAKDLSGAILDRYDREGENPNEAEKKNLKKALRLFKGVVAYEPTQYAPAMLAGKVAVALEEFSEAEYYFEQALANIFEPIPAQDVRFAAELHAQIANLAVLKNDFTRADFASQQALKLMPKNPDYMATRASALVQMKRTSEAKELLVAAIRIDRDNRRANQLLTLLNLEEVERGMKKAGL